MALPNITVQDLITEFGNVYINQGQNEKNLYTLLLQRSKTPSICTPVMTDNTQYRHALLTLGSVVQAFQKHFTPKESELKIEPRTINLFNIKIDESIYPDDIKQTWAGFWEALNEVDRSKWPMIRWVLEMLMIPRKEHELETLGYYKGVYSSPVANTPGTAIGAMDGLRKQLVTGLNEGRTRSLASVLAGITEDTAFDAIENAAKLIQTDYPELIEQADLQFCMSNRWLKAYQRDRRNTHGTDTVFDPNKITVDFYDNLRLVGLPSMVGTDDFFITPKANMLYLKRTGGAKPFDLQKDGRKVNILTDWWEGIGFAIDEFVFAYVDQGTSS